jgi:hypothetical protein
LTPWYLEAKSVSTEKSAVWESIKIRVFATVKPIAGIAMHTFAFKLSKTSCNANGIFMTRMSAEFTQITEETTSISIAYVTRLTSTAAVCTWFIDAC